MLSQGAFNALLKTLEEPPSYAIFILATTEKHKVLPTILSRCQVYDFNRITVQDTVQYLQTVAAKEGITVSEEALNAVAQKADGGMRDALSIFDQLVAFCGSNITYEQTIQVLNVLDTDYYFRLVNFALSHDVSNALLLLNDVLNHGFDAGHFVTGFAEHLRDVLVSKDPQTVALLETSDAIRRRYADQAQLCSPLWLFQALDIMNTCDINYRTARNKRLTVELALVKLTQLGVAQNIPNIQSNPSTPIKSQPAPPLQKPTPAPQPTPQPASAPQPAPQAVPSIPKMPSTGLGWGPKKGEQDTNLKSPITNTPPKEESNAPFTADQLKDAWAGLIRSHKDEPRLVQLMEAYSPVLSGKEEAEIQMPNPWQYEEMRKALPALVRQLHGILHNTHLSIRATLAEYSEEQLAVTAEEKYKLMADGNPLIGEMKEQLGLLID